MTNLIALPTGTELVGDYRIQRVLGAGGFGVTYLADEMALTRVVTIKEYFPSDFAARTDGIKAAPRSSDCAGDFKWGLDRFIEEAQTLARFDHPNIVRVYRYFRANSTGYMVLQFEEGQSLKSWLKSLSRAPRQKELDAMIAPLLDALDLIHKADYLHRDIAPDNIIIRKDGAPVLIDFGSARGDIVAHSRTVSALVKPGYSPYEQYAETSRQQGPWSDMYALAATLYHAITGKRPPDSPSRMMKDDYIPAREAAVGAYRANFLKAIDRALLIQVDARPQSVAVWRNELFAPDTPKGGWLSRGRASKGEIEANEPDQATPTPPPVPVAAPVAGPPVIEVAPAAPPPNAAAPVIHAPMTAPPPLPPHTPLGASATSAPPKKSGLFGFWESLKTPSDVALAERPVVAEPIAQEPPPLPAKPKPKPRAKSKPKSQRPAPEPRVAEPKAGPPPLPSTPTVVTKKAPAERVQPVRPRPVRTAQPGEARSTLGWKVLIALTLSGGLVAFQDRLPKLPGTSPSTTAALSSPEANLLLREIKAHSGEINGIAFSEDGRTLVSAARDATLKTWSATSGALQKSIPLDNRLVTALAVSGRRAVTGHGEGIIGLYDFEAGTRLTVLKRNEADIWSVAFLANPDLIASASHDWTASVWDTKSPFAPQFTLSGHENAVQAVAYSAAGPWIATGSADKTVRLYDVTTHDLIRVYKGPKDFVTALAFSPDGKSLAVASLDGAIRLYSTASNRMQRQFTGHKGRIGQLAFTLAGDILASAADEGVVRLWDVKRGRSHRTLTGHTGGAKAVGFTPDGSKLASSGTDGVIRLWTVPPLKLQE
jgi:serine/threonine protein kinase